MGFCVRSAGRVQSLFTAIRQWTGVGVSERRRPAHQPKLERRLEPCRAILQFRRLFGRQFTNLWHLDRFPAKLTDFGQFRVAALWQFGGYDLNNAATGSYQLQIGGDIANLAGGTLSLDAIGSYVQNAVSIGLAGSTLPAVLPQVLTAT